MSITRGLVRNATPAQQLADMVEADGSSGGFIKDSQLDTDGTLAANNATRVPAQSAVVTYVTAAIAAVRDGVSAAYDTLAEIATDLATRALQATTISAAGLATGGGSLAANRTITVTGATAADQETATSTAVAVTPAVQQRHPSAAKAWARVRFSAGTPSVASGYNVSGVVDAGVGNTRITLATAMSAEAFCGVVTLAGASGLIFTASTAANSFVVRTTNVAGTDTDIDFDVVIYGDQ